MVQNKDEITSLYRLNKDSCRMAVYDHERTFLGYKSDASWTLNHNHFRPHPQESCKLDNPLMNNLVDLVNRNNGNNGWVEGIQIDVEKLNLDGTVENILARYQLQKDATGQYQAIELPLTKSSD